jgi:hypothetical protein
MILLKILSFTLLICIITVLTLAYFFMQHISMNKYK